MKIIHTDTITQEVARLCQEANFFLGKDVLNAFKKALEVEESHIGREILEQLIENAEIASREQVAMCQDTGYTVIYLELGQDVKITGGDLEDAINAGVRLGYAEGYLRRSVVEHPFRRKNTGDNTPAVIHTQIVPGENLKIIVAPKGGGSENMSQIKMLKPADGKKGVMDFVVKTIREAGPNPCPPIVVGVGIGGTFEKCAYLAKKALLRELGTSNPDPEIAEMEQELLQRINRIGIGPAGLGGVITALAVHIEIHPCHIASLPVAVNLNCNAARHKEVVL